MFGIYGLGCMVQGLWIGFGVLEFRVVGLGFKSWRLGFQVSGCRFQV